MRRADLPELADIQRAYGEYRQVQSVVQDHSRQRQEYLDLASAEEKASQGQLSTATSSLVEAVGKRPVGDKVKAVPAIVKASFESLVISLPEDYLYVMRLEGVKWRDHIFGPPDADMRRECVDVHEEMVPTNDGPKPKQVNCGALLYMESRPLAEHDPENVPQPLVGKNAHEKPEGSF